MFRFQFDLEDDGLDEATSLKTVQLPEEGYHVASKPQQVGVPFTEIGFNSLLEALPTQISYSFISAPSPGGRLPELKLARRDLFDARFQLISDESTGDPESACETSGSDPNSAASALQFIDNPSDLVPLVYEGGLKTWECSLDLASCLRRDGHATNAKGRRVLELGCGTAIPTLCILQDIFSSLPTDDNGTHIHLQDYNASVLQLVTLPNVVLAWYTSPAANAYRSSADHEDVDSELHITPQLLDAFKTSLHEHKLYLRFFSGSWDTFDLCHAGGPYHLVLTSETIYHPRSLPTLVRVLSEACSGGHECCCLVAAKTVYFGVGGGIKEFVQCVEATEAAQERGGRVETVWEIATGVSRRVMRVWWT